MMDIAWFKRLNGRVLELTDELGIHREAVSISLERAGDGSATLSGPKLTVTAPSHDDVEAFISTLRDRLDGMDLSGLPKAED